MVVIGGGGCHVLHERGRGNTFQARRRGPRSGPTHDAPTRGSAEVVWWLWMHAIPV